jgi:hypothetical protein
MPLHREERDELAPSQLIEEHSVPYQSGPLYRISNGQRSVSGWYSELKDVGLQFFGQRSAFFGQPFVDLCFGIEIRGSRIER